MTPLSTDVSVPADNNVNGDNTDNNVNGDNNHVNNDDDDNNNVSNDNINDNNDNIKEERSNAEEVATATATTKKRARGRPPGSKNKPKTPAYVAVDQQNAVHHQLLEVESGADIVSCLTAYARSRGLGVSVVHATGTVSGGISFQNHLNAFPLKKWELINLSGTVLPDNTVLIGKAGLTVIVTNTKGQLMGGRVEGRLVAEGPVSMLVATFRASSYERLPAAPQQEAGGSGYYPNPAWNHDMSMGLANRVPGTSSGGQDSSYGWYVQPQNNGAPPSQMDTKFGH